MTADPRRILRPTPSRLVRGGVVVVGGAALGLALSACTRAPDCAEGQVEGPDGGCIVEPLPDCPEGQILSPGDGQTCIDPFATSTDTSGPDDTGADTDLSDTDTDTDTPPDDTADTDLGVGDTCDWVVRLTTGDDPAEVAWSLIRDRDDAVLASIAPGDLTEPATAYPSAPVPLAEGEAYTLRAIDLGGDGWEGGTVVVHLDGDPLTLALSNGLSTGSEALFPFNVLCP